MKRFWIPKLHRLDMIALMIRVDYTVDVAHQVDKYVWSIRGRVPTEQVVEMVRYCQKLGVKIEIE